MFYDLDRVKLDKEHDGSTEPGIIISVSFEFPTGSLCKRHRAFAITKQILFINLTGSLLLNRDRRTEPGTIDFFRLFTFLIGAF